MRKNNIAIPKAAIMLATVVKVAASILSIIAISQLPVIAAAPL